LIAKGFSSACRHYGQRILFAQNRRNNLPLAVTKGLNAE